MLSILALKIKELETLTNVNALNSNNPIATYTNEDGDIDTIYENVSTIRRDGSQIIYTDETGRIDTINTTELETLTRITIDTATGIITYYDEDLDSTTLDIGLLIDSLETVTSVVQGADSTFTYIENRPGFGSTSEGKLNYYVAVCWGKEIFIIKFDENNLLATADFMK